MPLPEGVSEDDIKPVVRRYESPMTPQDFKIAEEALRKLNTRIPQATP